MASGTFAASPAFSLSRRSWPYADAGRRACLPPSCCTPPAVRRASLQAAVRCAACLVASGHGPSSESVSASVERMRRVLLCTVLKP